MTFGTSATRANAASRFVEAFGRERPAVVTQEQPVSGRASVSLRGEIARRAPAAQGRRAWHVRTASIALVGRAKVLRALAVALAVDSHAAFPDIQVLHAKAAQLADPHAGVEQKMDDGDVARASSRGTGGDDERANLFLRI
jgi:hypothetical protein